MVWSFRQDIIMRLYQSRISEHIYTEMTGFSYTGNLHLFIGV